MKNIKHRLNELQTEKLYDRIDKSKLKKSIADKKKIIDENKIQKK